MRLCVEPGFPPLFCRVFLPQAGGPIRPVWRTWRLETWYDSTGLGTQSQLRERNWVMSRGPPDPALWQLLRLLPAKAKGLMLARLL